MKVLSCRLAGHLILTRSLNRLVFTLVACGFVGVMVSVGAQGCVSPPANIAAWGRGEANFNDLISTNVLQTGGGVTFTLGRVGQSFVFDGTSSFLRALQGPDLDLGSGAGLTIELWLKPLQVGSSAPLLEWNDGLGGIGVHFRSEERRVGKECRSRWSP